MNLINTSSSKKAGLGFNQISEINKRIQDFNETWEIYSLDESFDFITNYLKGYRW